MARHSRQVRLLAKTRQAFHLAPKMKYRALLVYVSCLNEDADHKATKFSINK